MDQVSRQVRIGPAHCAHAVAAGLALFTGAPAVSDGEKPAPARLDAPVPLTFAYQPQPVPDSGGGDAADLAKQLSNSVADLISVPLQFNYDEGFGPDDAERFTLNIQPVIPFSLSEV